MHNFYSGCFCGAPASGKLQGIFAFCLCVLKLASGLLRTREARVAAMRVLSFVSRLFFWCCGFVDASSGSVPALSRTRKDQVAAIRVPLFVYSPTSCNNKNTSKTKK